ncbi:MAG: M6 family metalloprotease domain-containing protein [Prevotella sp.]|nr:M6 family metalloprotease domain-containing protein [Prevotella sp.]
MIICISAWAVKADPRPVDVKQADGTTLTVVLHGDEDFHYYTTTDGILLVQHQGAYYVASTCSDGSLVATSLLAHNAAQRTIAEQTAAHAQDMTRFMQRAESEAHAHRLQREPIETTGNMFPHVGSPRVVVILAEFADTTFTIENTKRSFEDYFNSMEADLQDYGRGENRNASSVGKYFADVSFGNFTPQFDVYGPVRLPDSLKVYGGTVAGGDGENMGKLMKDACTLMNDSLDFSQYDANNDGEVDLVIILYAGYSESMGGNSAECIWPKSGTTAGGTYDGKTVSRYAVSAELNGFPGCWSSAPWQRINGIGTLCHEFCHTMGMPDFYPTGKQGQSVKGNNQAMEYWSLMDSGNYLINGYEPVAMTAWEREAFGWIEISDLIDSQDLDLTSIDADGIAYRIANDNDNTGNEYFIIENIQNIGHNRAQKGHGMLVYHIDYDPNLFSMSYNKVNNTKGHPRMTIVPADNLLFAQYNVGQTIDGVYINNKYFYDELAGDPFPGTSHVTALNDTTGHVNFKVFNGGKLDKAFDEITEKSNGVVSLKFITQFEEYVLGINDLQEERPVGDEHVYTLDGRRVDNHATLPKGIYIRNGKKMVIKD